MTKDSKFSRYKSTNKALQPPSMQQVFRLLKKQADASGSLGNSNIPQCARSIAARANKFYEDRGKADDLWRFLLNTSVVIQHSNGLFYFDQEQSVHVSECCENGSAPNTTTNADARIAAMLEHARRNLQAEPAPQAHAPRPQPLRDAPHTDDPPPTKKETRPVDQDVQKPEEQQAPVSASAPASDSPQSFVDLPEIPPTFVLFLTPAENDVWETMQILPSNVEGEWRVGIWRDVDKLKEEWASRTSTAQGFHAALQRFIDRGFLRLEGSTSDNRDTYTITVDPRLFHVVKIVDREVRRIPKVYETVIRQMRQLNLVFGNHHVELKEWLASEFPELNPGTLYTKFFNYFPNIDHAGWGVLVAHEESGQILKSFPGFERFEIVVEDSMQPRVLGERKLKNAKTKKRGEMQLIAAPIEAAVHAQPAEASGGKQVERMSLTELDRHEELLKQTIAHLQAELDRVAAARQSAEKRERLAKQLEDLERQKQDILRELSTLL